VEGALVSSWKPNRPKYGSDLYALGTLCLLLPMILGGCPEFQDEFVNALDTAVSGLLNAALDLYFDQFRSSGGF
jgi:hypothetical protein